MPLENLENKSSLFRISVRLRFKNTVSRSILLVIAGLGLTISGCETNSLSQCSQLFQIAANVSESNHDLLVANVQQLDQPEDLKNWLQAAQRLEQAAANIQTLEIDQGKLIGLQHQLATIYRIYAQATYDAVRARENFNRESLSAAREDAVAAGKMQKALIEELNDYCLNPNNPG